MSGVLRTQLSGVARRPSRLLLTGLAMLVASFVVYATVLAQQITTNTVLDNNSTTLGTVDFALRGVSTEQLAKVAAVPGVGEVAGRIDSGGSFGNDYLGITADPGTGVLAVAHLTKGRYPSAPREIAVTPRTADRLGLPVGSTISLSVGYTADGKPKPAQKLTVVGLVDARDDYGATAYAPQRFVTQLSGETTLSQIDVHLAPGASATSVRAALDAIVAAVPKPGDNADQPSVQTGQQIRDHEARESISGLNSLFAVVGMFVAIALVAAALVATSTFRIVFAQRMRQLALLRAVGAGRRSLSGALAAEGALTGLVVGVVGVLGALLVGNVLPPIARALGSHLSGPGFPVLKGLGVIALSVLITVLAVLAPAASASKVAPLEALRSSSVTAGRRDIGKLRWAFGLLLVAGAALLAAFVVTQLPGRDPENYDPSPVLLAIVASGALAFFALVTLGPVLVRPVLAAIGWPLRRLGPIGRLAVGGVGGAPRRAAAVSVVVALGVTLIAGVLVGGASIRVLTDRELATSAPADYEVTANDDATLTPAMLAKARASKDVKDVVPYRRVDEITLNGNQTPVDANDLSLAALPATLSKMDVQAGSLRDVGPGKAILSGFAASISGLKAGDTADLKTKAGAIRVRVTAVLPDQAPLHSGLIMDPSDLTRLGAKTTYSGFLADAAAGGETGRTAGRQALRQVTGNAAGLGIAVLADERDQINFNLDAILAVAIGLVGLTVLIAVVGVGTTTALSVVERVRESGLLRAVGLSRAGLRGLLTAESALYGVIGSAIGLILGIPYAWLAIKALGATVPLRLPYGQLALVFVVLVAFTALSGVLPARRAAKVSPVVALGTDA